MRTFLCILCASVVMFAQEPTPERATVPFSDPSKPGKIKVGLVNGGIIVKGYEGKDVIIEVRSRDGGNRRRRGPEENTGGLRRIPQNSAGLNVEEQNNVMHVSTGSFNSDIEMTLQVPVNTSLNLSTVNGGDIRVDRVRGELEVNNVNGNVDLNNISGSVVAHAMNGHLIATLDEVAAGKAMSFSSFNGKVDVTMPCSTKAHLVMRSDQGEILSDFDVKMETTAAKPQVEDSRGKGGKYHLQVEKTVYGTINGGGPDFQFKNFNGNIYIRCKK